jgi:peptidoglycan hydrolase-like protein with peptidoglycan-binding domain
VDKARDLGRVDVWEDSLKRSLERRGRPRRASVELYRLRPARDLKLGDVLERSAHYSELRRRAAQRPAMPRPSVAIGGVSALALVAGSTLPSLLGGGRAAKNERLAYAADVHSQARTDAAVAGTRSASAPVTSTHLTPSRHGARTASAHTGSGTTRAAASKANPRAARSAAAITSSGGSGLTNASSVKRGGASIKLVSDHTSSVLPAVSAVQQVQQRLGVDPVDGSFGAMTEQAVKQFQTSHGLDANGVVGAATRQALGIGPGPTLSPQAASVDPAPAGAPPVIQGRPSVTKERQASSTSAVQYTGGVSTHTVPTVTQRHPTPVHATPPTTETTTGSTQPSQSAPSGDTQTGVQRMIAAGNRIATRPYVYGGGHGSFSSRGYDCSGSVSYVLHAAGLLKAPMDSTELESYGKPGPGRYVSIYANSGHAWMTIQGRRFDTAAQAQTGSRWSHHMRSTSGYVVRHPTHY